MRTKDISSRSLDIIRLAGNMRLVRVVEDLLVMFLAGLLVGLMDVPECWHWPIGLMVLAVLLLRRAFH